MSPLDLETHGNTPVRRHQILGGAVVLLVFWLLVSGSGCQPAKSAAASAPEAATPQSLLDIVRTQLLEEKPSIAVYRSVVQQLNLFADQQPALTKTWTLSSSERGLVLGTLLTGVDRRRERFEELESKSFSITDAYHLDACFLFRDAAQALLNDMGPRPSRGADADWLEFNLALLDHVWSWLNRHLQPTARSVGGPLWPPHDVLRRGWADPEERLLVFCNLLEQLNLFATEERQLRLLDRRKAQAKDPAERVQLEQETKELRDLINRNKIEACAVTRLVPVRASDGTETLRQVPWLAGVLIGQELFLYDPVRGSALPGPTPGRPLTWRELRAQPALLAQLFPGPDAPLPGQIEKSEALVAVSYPALAPRMRWLESVLDDNPVQLYVDLPAHLDRLANANLGLVVRPWTSETRPGYPTMLVHQFMPVRDTILREAVVPRYLLGHWIHEMAANIGVPQYVQPLFEPFDAIFLRARMETGGIRDLLVRGRPSEAIQKIVLNEDHIDKMMDQFHLGDILEKKYMMETWRHRIESTAIQLRDTQRRLLTASEAERPVLESEVQSLAQRLEALWRDKRAIYSNLIVEWALPEYREHLTYFMALAKLDLAERLALRSAQLRARSGQDAARQQELKENEQRERELYESAEFWLDRYEAMVATQVRANWLAGVRQLRAYCAAQLARLGPVKTAALP